jgi:hypothetical protein
LLIGGFSNCAGEGRKPYLPPQPERQAMSKAGQAHRSTIAGGDEIHLPEAFSGSDRNDEIGAAVGMCGKPKTIHLGQLAHTCSSMEHWVKRASGIHSSVLQHTPLHRGLDLD